MKKRRVRWLPLLVAILVAACTVRPVEIPTASAVIPSATPVATSSPPRPSESVEPASPPPWDALRRPLSLPTVAPGGSCPLTLGHDVYAMPLSSATLPLDLGPVLPFFRPEEGVLHRAGIEPVEGWYPLRVLWVSEARYRGPVLVRGRQLDGPNELAFSSPRGWLGTELRLPVEPWTSSEGWPPGWREWASQTWARTDGCYAYQVDGLDFSAIVVFGVMP